MVKASAVKGLAVRSQTALPSIVERAGGAARFAWDEFFYAQHHAWDRGNGDGRQDAGNHGGSG
jgi:hypothetical protein